MAESIKYSMQWRIQYEGNLTAVLDELRGIQLVLMCNIDKDLGRGKELVTVKLITPHPPKQSFIAVRQLALSKIPALKSVELLYSTLTKMF